MGAAFYRLYWFFREDVGAIPGRVLAFAFIALVFLLPIVNSEPYLLRILILMSIYIIFAVSWDFLSGFTGVLNFGHAAFFGISAYATAMLNSNFGWPAWVTIPVGSFIAMGMGLVIGAPALRLRGIYLALVTLAFPIMLQGLVYAFPDYTGGELGLFGISPLAFSRIAEYYIVLIVMVLSVLIMWKLTDLKSKKVRTGLIFRAINQDEITARACGTNTTFYKFLAFAGSGFFCGVSGGLYAHFIKVVGPSTLELLFSFNAILWTIFGGMGTIFGPVVGVCLLFPLTEFLGVHPLGEEIRFLLLAVVLILTLLFMPEGISVWVLDKIEAECPRCKLTNYARRKKCRACGAQLHIRHEGE